MMILSNCEDTEQLQINYNTEKIKEKDDFKKKFALYKKIERRLSGERKGDMMQKKEKGGCL